MYNEGDLKVWWIPQMPMDAFELPMDPFEVPVSSPAQGAFLLNVLAEYDAFQLLNNVKPDYCNFGGLMVFEGGEWCDWQDEETFEDDAQDKFPQTSLGWCANLPK